MTIVSNHAASSIFQSFVATNTSSRLITPALNTSCIASPTSSSFR
jgi:hypothetical protein